MKKTVNTLINLSLLALALLALVSCDNESSVPGGLVTMKIDFRGMEAGSSEDLRSASSETVSSQRIVLPSGEEWQVDLRIDPESPLRATTLASNSYIRLLAIDGSGNLVRYVDWQQDVDNVPDLYIPAGTTCRFICYSYNNSNNTLPSGYTEGSILPALSVRDGGSKELLLWQTTAATTINSAGTISDVVLTPQLTQVKLKLDCSGDGKTITGVSTTTPITITSGYTGGTTYNLAGGGLVTAVSSSDEPFTWLTSTFGGTTVTSDPLALVPQTGFSLKIPAGAITLQTGVSQNTLTEIPFPTSELKAGKTHTISVKLLKIYTKFASSNIYWDATNNQLTFEPYSPEPQNCPTCANSDKNYQGVYFRFGSLIGMSPVGDWSANATTGTPIYVPYYGDGTNPKWVESKAGKTDDDVSGIPGATAHIAWTWPSTATNTIPYEKNGTGSTLGRDDTWVIDAARNEAADWNAYTGDICQYISTTQNLGGMYRLPTSNEFGSPDATAGSTISWNTSTLTDGWLKVSGNNGTSSSSWSTNNDNPDVTGKRTTIRSGGSYGSTGNFFPASASRDFSDGKVHGTGTNAAYWSGSVNSYGYFGYFWSFSTDYFSPANSSYRNYCFLVRCVLQ